MEKMEKVRSKLVVMIILQSLVIILMAFRKPSERVVIKHMNKYHTTIRKCTPAEAYNQNKLFSAAKVRGCPPFDDIWLRLIHAHTPDAAVFVDIGSNKGFFGARIMQLWSPTCGYSSKKHFTKMKQLWDKSLIDCGACGDCVEDTPPIIDHVDRLCSTGARSSSSLIYASKLKKATDEICSSLENNIQIYSFDGNKQLVDGLKKIANEFDHWHVGHAVFSDKCSGPLKFVEKGELGHIITNYQLDEVEGKIETVDCKTIDGMFEELELDFVDLVKIDVEGHDASVLEGATEAFSGQRLGAIIFEYNTPWPDEINGLQSLKYVVDKLETYNYVCYFEGKNLLIRLTSCWGNEFENKIWSNVICISNLINQGLVQLFDKHSIAFSR